MTYEMVQRLSSDPNFRQRVQSCMYEQAQTYSTDSDAATAWMGNEQLKGNNITTNSMVSMIASFPGLADEATVTSATGVSFLDQMAITDETILSQVQNQWKTIADLFYVPPPVSLPAT
jgi:hypothetical protein